MSQHANSKLGQPLDPDTVQRRLAVIKAQGGISLTAVSSAVSSAGYKVVDKYAARISRGGTHPKIKGRAHWIVCDPMADEDAQVCVPFDCPRQAEAMLNGLQNLRAA